MKLSDEALVQACRYGDAAAWEELVERYQRLVFAIARHAGLDDEQAADVFQRVFATLVERLDQIEQPALLGAWLTTTARHEAWRFSRRERALRRGLSPEGQLLTTPVDDSQLPDEIVLRLEQQHAVYTAVQALDPRCRDLIALLFYQQAPPAYSDVAVRLGMSEGSIGPTRARCLKKLRQLLEPGESVR